MRVLVTGASRVMGSCLVKNLRAKSYQLFLTLDFSILESRTI